MAYSDCVGARCCGGIAVRAWVWAMLLVLFEFCVRFADVGLWGDVYPTDLVFVLRICDYSGAGACVRVYSSVLSVYVYDVFFNVLVDYCYCCSDSSALVVGSDGLSGVPLCLCFVACGDCSLLGLACCCSCMRDVPVVSVSVSFVCVCSFCAFCLLLMRCCAFCCGVLCVCVVLYVVSVIRCCKVLRILLLRCAVSDVATSFVLVIPSGILVLLSLCLPCLLSFSSVLGVVLNCFYLARIAPMPSKGCLKQREKERMRPVRE